jgi:hypothetical protein
MNYTENPTPINPTPYPPYYKRDSSLAVASLVCGLATWFFLPVLGAIAAVITGHMAKKEIRESAGTLSGDGMAVAGLILGYTQLGLLLIAVVCVVSLLAVGFSGFDNGSSILNGPSAMILRSLI